LAGKKCDDEFSMYSSFINVGINDLTSQNDRAIKDYKKMEVVMSEPKIKITKEYVELRVNSKIYSKETIFAVGYVFLDKAYILLDEDKKDVVIYVYPQKKTENLKKLGLEFCNELLNYAHYFTRVKENADAVKTIMQRALFSAAPTLVQEAEEQEIEDLIKELEDGNKCIRIIVEFQVKFSGYKNQKSLILGRQCRIDILFKKFN